MSKSYYNISHINRGTIVWVVLLMKTNLFLSSQLQTDNNKIADTFCILILNYFFESVRNYSLCKNDLPCAKI